MVSPQKKSISKPKYGPSRKVSLAQGIATDERHQQTLVLCPSREVSSAQGIATDERHQQT
jgi:hypothetical protein